MYISSDRYSRGEPVMSGEASPEGVRRMADVLRGGGTMLSETCPQCSSPLFRLASGDIYCVNCNRKVVIVKDDLEASQVVSPSVLGSLEETIVLKLQELDRQMRNEGDSRNLQSTVTTITGLLDALQRIRHFKKSSA